MHRVDHDIFQTPFKNGLEQPNHGQPAAAIHTRATAPIIWAIAVHAPSAPSPATASTGISVYLTSSTSWASPWLSASRHSLRNTRRMAAGLGQATRSIPSLAASTSHDQSKSASEPAPRIQCQPFVTSTAARTASDSPSPPSERQAFSVSNIHTRR